MSNLFSVRSRLVLVQNCHRLNLRRLAAFCLCQLQQTAYGEDSSKKPALQTEEERSDSQVDFQTDIVTVQGYKI